MAEEAKEPNSVGEDNNVEGEEPEAAGLVEDGKEQSNEEEQTSKPATESTWSAPILSLARKATETISSGVNTYGAALKTTAPGTATNSSEVSTVNEVKNTGKHLFWPVSLSRLSLVPYSMSRALYETHR